MATTAERLQSAMTARNVDQAQLADGVGCSQGAISQILTGSTQRSRFLPDIAIFLRVSLEWLKGHGEEEDFEKFAGMKPEVAAEQFDLVPLAEVDMSYGMGGAFVEDAPVVTIHQFPRLWVETITSSPSSCLYIARGRGSSMEPTMRDGDMLVIDKSERVVRDQDDLWAFTIGEIGMVKRLRVRGERVTILSDNPIVPDDFAHPDEINILGKVIFVGRRM